MKALVAFLMIAILGFTTACAPKRKSEEKPLLKAYRLIDDQRTEEAIAYLEELLEKEPDNTDYKVALASAYAHKAGVRMQTLAPVVSAAKDANDLGEKLMAGLNALEGSDTKTIGTYIGDLIEANQRLLAVVGLIKAIPNVDGTGIQYIHQGLTILDGISEIRPADAVYRAVLRIVQLKHDLVSNGFTETTAANALDATCVFDPTELRKVISRQSQLLSKIVGDIAIAQPSEAKRLSEVQTKLVEKATELTSRLASSNLTNDDDPTTIEIKRALLNHGFGRLLKCGGEKNDK